MNESRRKQVTIKFPICQKKRQRLMIINFRSDVFAPETWNKKQETAGERETML